MSEYISGLVQYYIADEGRVINLVISLIFPFVVFSSNFNLGVQQYSLTISVVSFLQHFS